MCSLVARIKLPLWNMHFYSLQRNIIAVVLQVSRVLRYRCVQLGLQAAKLPFVLTVIDGVVCVAVVSSLFCKFIVSIKAIGNKAAEISATFSLFLSATESRLTATFVQEMTQKKSHVSIFDSSSGRSGGCSQTTVRWSSWIWLTQDLACLHVVASLRSAELPMFVLTLCQNWNWTLFRLAKWAFVKLLRSVHRQKRMKHL